MFCFFGSPPPTHRSLSVSVVMSIYLLSFAVSFNVNLAAPDGASNLTHLMHPSAQRPQRGKTKLQKRIGQTSPSRSSMFFPASSTTWTFSRQHRTRVCLLGVCLNSCQKPADRKSNSKAFANKKKTFWEFPLCCLVQTAIKLKHLFLKDADWLRNSQTTYKQTNKQTKSISRLQLCSAGRACESSDVRSRGFRLKLENRTETTEEHPGTLHLSGEMREILRRIRTGTANMINFMHLKKNTFASARSCKVQLHYLPS